MKELTSLNLAKAAGRLALSKKGFDVKILKLKSISSICDYFVIASGEADVQVRAIAKTVEEELIKLGVKPLHREGYTAGKWILLDYVDVVIHIFHDATRQFYALEKLWGDAPTEELTEQ